MMTATVIDLDSRRRVWRVVKGRCRCCQAQAISTQPQGCPLDHAECHSCGAFAFAVTHYEVQGKLVPRMEALS